MTENSMFEHGQIFEYFQFFLTNLKGTPPPLFVDFQCSMMMRPIRLNFLPQIEHLK
jgi:hypothetical protein